jgi:hypothetical protein
LRIESVAEIRGERPWVHPSGEQKIKLSKASNRPPGSNTEKDGPTLSMRAPLSTFAVDRPADPVP